MFVGLIAKEQYKISAKSTFALHLLQILLSPVSSILGKTHLLPINPVNSYWNNLFFWYATISYSTIFTCHIVAGYPIQMSAIRVCVFGVICRSLLTAVNSNHGDLSSLAG